MLSDYPVKEKQPSFRKNNFSEKKKEITKKSDSMKLASNKMEGLFFVTVLFTKQEIETYLF